MHDIFNQTYSRTWLHMRWFSTGSPERSADDESMLRAERLEALVKEVALEMDMSASSYVDARSGRRSGGGMYRVTVLQEKGLALTSHQLWAAVDELATETSGPS